MARLIVLVVTIVTACLGNAVSAADGPLTWIPAAAPNAVVDRDVDGAQAAGREPREVG